MSALQRYLGDPQYARFVDNMTARKRAKANAAIDAGMERINRLQRERWAREEV